MIIENVIIVVIDSTDRKKGNFSFDFRRGGRNPSHLCSFWWGGNLLRGRILPPSGTVKGGEFSPPGMISLPLEKLFTKIV